MEAGSGILNDSKRKPGAITKLDQKDFIRTTATA